MEYYYALIKNGRVSAKLQTHSPISAGNMIAIESLDAVNLGDSYTNGAFTAPAVVISRRIKAHALKHRLTSTERIAIRNAAKTNDQVFDFLDLLNSAPWVDLGDQARVRTPLQSLETAGLLFSGRALTVLDAEIQDEERA